jgi:hypothetical protein
MSNIIKFPNQKIVSGKQSNAVDRKVPVNDLLTKLNHSEFKRRIAELAKVNDLVIAIEKLAAANSHSSDTFREIGFLDERVIAANLESALECLNRFAKEWCKHGKPETDGLSKRIREIS